MRGFLVQIFNDPVLFIMFFSMMSVLGIVAVVAFKGELSVEEPSEVFNVSSLRLGENATVELSCSSCKVVILINKTLFEEGRLYIIYVYANGCFRAYSPTQRLTADVCHYAKLQHSVDWAPTWGTNYTLYLTSHGATSYTIVVKATTYQDPDYGPFCRPW